MLLLERSAKVLSMAGVLAVLIAGQPGPANLKPGDTLPTLAGQTIKGQSLDLPDAIDDNQAVLIFSFSRAGGRDAQRWEERLSKSYPHLSIYTAIFLESVPRLFRPLAIRGIRSGMPVFLQARTMLLYRDESFWERRLHVADESHASVILLGRGGQIRWITSGPFTDSLCAALERQIRASNGSSKAFPACDSTINNPREAAEANYRQAGLWRRFGCKRDRKPSLSGQGTH